MSPLFQSRPLRGMLLVLAGVLTMIGAAHAAPITSQQQQIHQLLTRYHQLGQLDGTVLVAEHGKVVYQHAFGLADREWKVPNTVDGAYRIASLTKQFTATLVMQLVEQGKLKLDDKIAKYVPDLRPEIGDKVTIHQLLNHTSGIVDYANFPGFWANRLGERVPRADFIAIMNHELEFVPGSIGHYNSSGYTLLGYVIEKVSGKSYGQALDDMILKPLAMTRSAYDAPEKLIERKAFGYVRTLGKYQPAPPLWIPNIGSGGGMVSSVGDFLKWDQALYGDKLLSAESKRQMFTPYVKDDVWGDLGYGYGWMIGKRDIAGKSRLVHEHGGNANGYRTLITRYPEDQRLIVILLNEGNGNKAPGIYQLKDGITKILYGQKATMPKIALADALITSFDKQGVTATLSGFDAIRASAAPATTPDGLNTLAYGYAGAGRFDEALAALKLNLRLFPKDGNSYDTMGEINLMQNDKTSARANYKRALELDPTNSNAAEVLGKLGNE